VLAAVVTLTAGAATGLTGPAAAAYEQGVHTILCDCGCHPQSVHDCACGRAAEMREEIRAMAARGMSGPEILADYVARHGDKILIAPKARGFDLVAWVAPLVGLVLATGGVAMLARRWARRDPEFAPADTPAPELSPEDEAFRARLRREVEESR